MFKTSNKLIHFVLFPISIAFAILLGLKIYPVLITSVFAILILGSWLISKLELQLHFFRFFAFVLPFSIELEISSGSNILLPGEPMIGMLLMVMFFDFLNGKLDFKSLFKGELLYLLPFIAVYLVASLFSSNAIISLKYIIINVSYILVFLFQIKMYMGKYPNLFQELIKIYSLSFVIVIIWSLYQFWAYDFNRVTIRGIFRPFYKDHTITGATAAILSAYWLSIAFFKDYASKRIMAAAIGMIFLLTVILTHSRAAILSTIVFVIVITVLKSGLRIQYMAALGIALIFTVSVFNSRVHTFLVENKNVSRAAENNWTSFIKSSANITSDDSNIERLNRWYAGLQMFREKPVLGYGPGTYQFEYIPFQLEELKNKLTVENPYKIPENSGGTAHSEFILALSEMGLLGFISFVLIMFRITYISIGKSVSLKNKWIIISFSSLSTYLFHANFNNFLNTDKFAFLFWGMISLLFYTYETAEKKQHDRIE